MLLEPAGYQGGRAGILHGARTDRGFTLVELMVTVLILGVLMALVIPAYAAAVKRAERATCFSNQRTIEGAAQAWCGGNASSIDPIVGLVSVGSPLMTEFKYPPTCPAAPKPVDPTAPTAAEGAYELDNTGTVVEGCRFGSPKHGHY